MHLTPQQLAEIFNEWARRYADDPTAFSDILDQHGRPFKDYGERSAAVVAKLAAELFPSPPPLRAA